ncbi:MAG: PEP-CTERM sorting domain-containing protein [Sedimentisphaerales bacterium]
MYDNSELFMYGPDSSVAYLYLYENVTASFYGCSYMNELYIDPANTGSVKLYADFDRFEPLGPYGEGHLYGNWLSNGDPFNIHLVGHGAYSHIQFIPELATLVMLGLGGIAILKRRKR